MAETLPLVPSIPNYRVGTSLSGTQYILDVRWNARAEFWVMDLLAEDETPIRRGIVIVLGTLLAGREVSDEFPPGVFAAADLSNQGIDAGLDDLGTRVVVNYYPFEDFSE